MDVRNSVESLKTLLDISSTSSSQTSRGGKPAGSAVFPLKGDSATLSSAATEIAQGAQGEGIRAGKVAAVSAAIASGSYQVPASAVAAKLVDSMLAGLPS